MYLFSLKMPSPAPRHRAIPVRSPCRQAASARSHRSLHCSLQRLDVAFGLRGAEARDEFVQTALLDRVAQIRHELLIVM